MSTGEGSNTDYSPTDVEGILFSGSSIDPPLPSFGTEPEISKDMKPLPLFPSRDTPVKPIGQLFTSTNGFPLPTDISSSSWQILLDTSRRSTDTTSSTNRNQRSPPRSPNTPRTSINRLEESITKLQNMYAGHEMKMNLFREKRISSPPHPSPFSASQLEATADVFSKDDFARGTSNTVIGNGKENANSSGQSSETCNTLDQISRVEELLSKRRQRNSHLSTTSDLEGNDIILPSSESRMPLEADEDGQSIHEAHSLNTEHDPFVSQQSSQDADAEIYASQLLATTGSAPLLNTSQDSATASLQRFALFPPVEAPLTSSEPISFRSTRLLPFEPSPYSSPQATPARSRSNSSHSIQYFSAARNASKLDSNNILSNSREVTNSSMVLRSSSSNGAIKFSAYKNDKIHAPSADQEEIPLTQDMNTTPIALSTGHSATFTYSVTPSPTVEGRSSAFHDLSASDSFIRTLPSHPPVPSTSRNTKFTVTDEQKNTYTYDSKSMQKVNEDGHYRSEVRSSSVKVSAPGALVRLVPFRRSSSVESHSRSSAASYEALDKIAGSTMEETRRSSSVSHWHDDTSSRQSLSNPLIRETANEVDTVMDSKLDWKKRENTSLDADLETHSVLSALTTSTAQPKDPTDANASHVDPLHSTRGSMDVTFQELTLLKPPDGAPQAHTECAETPVEALPSVFRNDVTLMPDGSELNYPFISLKQISESNSNPKSAMSGDMDMSITFPSIPEHLLLAKEPPEPSAAQSSFSTCPPNLTHNSQDASKDPNVLEPQLPHQRFVSHPSPAVLNVAVSQELGNAEESNEIDVPSSAPPDEMESHDADANAPAQHWQEQDLRFLNPPNYSPPEYELVSPLATSLPDGEVDDTEILAESIRSLQTSVAETFQSPYDSNSPHSASSRSIVSHTGSDDTANWVAVQNERVLALQAQVLKQHAIITKLEKKLVVSEHVEAENQKIRNGTMKILKQLERTKLENARLTEREKHLEAEVAKAAEVSRKCTKLERQLGKTDELVRIMQSQLDKTLSTNKSLQSELENRVLEIKTLRGERDALQQERDMLEEERGTMKESLSQLQQRKSALSSFQANSASAYMGALESIEKGEDGFELSTESQELLAQLKLQAHSLSSGLSLSVDKCSHLSAELERAASMARYYQRQYHALLQANNQREENSVVKGLTSSPSAIPKSPQSAANILSSINDMHSTRDQGRAILKALVACVEVLRGALDSPQAKQTAITIEEIDSFDLQQVLRRMAMICVDLQFLGKELVQAYVEANTREQNGIQSQAIYELSLKSLRDEFEAVKAKLEAKESIAKESMINPAAADAAPSSTISAMASSSLLAEDVVILDTIQKEIRDMEAIVFDITQRKENANTEVTSVPQLVTVLRSFSSRLSKLLQGCRELIATKETAENSLVHVLATVSQQSADTSTYHVVLHTLRESIKQKDFEITKLSSQYLELQEKHKVITMALQNTSEREKQLKSQMNTLAPLAKQVMVQRSRAPSLSRSIQSMYNSSYNPLPPSAEVPGSEDESLSPQSEAANDEIKPMSRRRTHSAPGDELNQMESQSSMPSIHSTPIRQDSFYARPPMSIKRPGLSFDSSQRSLESNVYTPAPTTPSLASSLIPPHLRSTRALTFASQSPPLRSRASSDVSLPDDSIGN